LPPKVFTIQSGRDIRKETKDVPNENDILKIYNETGQALTVLIGDSAIELLDMDKPLGQRTQSMFALKNTENTPDATLTLVADRKFVLLSFLKRTRWTDLQPLGPVHGAMGPVTFPLPFTASPGEGKNGVITAKRATNDPSIWEMQLEVTGKRGSYRCTIESLGGVEGAPGGGPLLRHDPDFDIEC